MKQFPKDEISRKVNRECNQARKSQGGTEAGKTRPEGLPGGSDQVEGTDGNYWDETESGGMGEAHGEYRRRYDGDEPEHPEGPCCY